MRHGQTLFNVQKMIQGWCDSPLTALGVQQAQSAGVKGLKEWNFGKYEAQSEFLNPPLPYGDFFKAAGGEGQSELQERIVRTVTELMSRPNHESVLIVTHGAALANFARAFDENALPAAKYRTGIKNCAIFHYLWDGKTFSCQQIIEND